MCGLTYIIRKMELDKKGGVAMRQRKRKAQSILEYVIVLTAVVAAFILAARGPVTNAVNQMFTDSTNTMTRETGEFHNQVGIGAQGPGN
jgi:Flp pilus assembly pilin Flp